MVSGAVVSFLSSPSFLSAPTCARGAQRPGPSSNTQQQKPTFEGGLRLLAREPGLAAALEGGLAEPARDAGLALDAGFDAGLLDALEAGLLEAFEAGFAFEAGLGAALDSGLA